MLGRGCPYCKGISFRTKEWEGIKVYICERCNEEFTPAEFQQLVIGKENLPKISARGRDADY